MLDLNRVIVSLSCMKQHRDEVDGVTGNRPPFQKRTVTLDISDYIVIVTTRLLFLKTMLINSVPDITPGRRIAMNVLRTLMDVTTIVQIIGDHFPAVATKDIRALAKNAKVCIKELDYELEISI